VDKREIAGAGARMGGAVASWAGAGYYWMWWRAFHLVWRFLEPILRRRRGLGISSILNG
jgi:hypothetical protein